MDVTELVIAGMGFVFSAVVIPLVRALFRWLSEKTQNEALLTALRETQDVADNVVAGLQGTLVAEMKKRSVDGKLSAGDAHEAADTARRMFFRDISERTLAVLQNNADDLGAYIGNLLEARLVRLKAQEDMNGGL